MRIPTSAAADVQDAFRALEARIKTLEAAAGNHNLAGQRLINAGDAVDASDYVTKRQLDAQVPATSDIGDFQSIVVRALARVLGALLLPQLTDGSKHHGVLYVDEAGQVAVHTDGAAAFDFNLDDGLLELGYGLRIKWIAALASIGAGASDGIITVEDAARTSFVRFVLGPDSPSGIALVKNGSTLEIRLGGGGALTDLTIDDLTADVVSANTFVGTIANGGNGVFVTVVIGTDPGGGDLLRVGGGATFNGDTNAHRVDGTSFRVNGHAGVDFGPGPIASITIEKGIVTAAS